MTDTTNEKIDILTEEITSKKKVILDESNVYTDEQMKLIDVDFKNADTQVETNYKLADTQVETNYKLADTKILDNFITQVITLEYDNGIIQDIKVGNNIIKKYYSLSEYPDAKTIQSDLANIILIQHYEWIPDSDDDTGLNESEYVDITFTSDCYYYNAAGKYDLYFEYSNDIVSDKNNHFLNIHVKTNELQLDFKSGETWRFFGQAEPFDNSKPGIKDPIKL